jgi:hypothetical protein
MTESWRKAAACIFSLISKEQKPVFMLQTLLPKHKQAATKKIFISYRVQDTAGETGRLVDALKQHFTDDQIFMDIENLEPGADFTVAISKSLDTCDVFLAIIGPHWIGDRDPSNIRIQDPNDWVRMEVSTALQRNIRVVPVLVDGAALPKAEQLPEDLQSLLRRQAIEVSNKRWRYDTDQLIQFLVNTVGIQPLKSGMRSNMPTTPPPKKNRTWMYVAGGFVLAIVVLGIIGSMMEQKENPVGPGSDSAYNVQTGNVTQPGSSSGTDKPPTATQTGRSGGTPSVAAHDVTGRWKEIDEGETSTFVLRQNGNYIDFQVELNGQIISNGTGTINENNVYLEFIVIGVQSTVRATLSGDGTVMNGTYAAEATGFSQPIKLVRNSR